MYLPDEWGGSTIPGDGADRTDYTKKISRTRYRKELRGLAFDWWLEKEFKTWFQKKMELLDLADKRLAEIVEMHVPEWEIEAAARAGAMQLELAEGVESAPLPPNFEGDEELTKIYRDSVREKASPYRDSAQNLFEHCLRVAHVTGWVSPTAKQCAENLTALSPKDFPSIEEVLPSAPIQHEGIVVPGLAIPTEDAFDSFERDAANQ